jgi:hypothetical protein
MKVVIICAVIALVLCLSTVNFAKGDGTVIAVDPPIYTVTQDQIGTTFTLNVNITDVASLWGWGFRLNWNPDILNVTKVQEGSFLKSAGGTLFVPPHRETGYLWDIGDALLVPSTANGSGILFTVTCVALAKGQSDITLNETRLERLDQTQIPNTVSNGQVTVVPEYPDLLILGIIFAGATAVILVKKRPKLTRLLDR